MIVVQELHEMRKVVCLCFNISLVKMTKEGIIKEVSPRLVCILLVFSRGLIGKRGPV